jgi:predicted Zn-dependent protease
VDPLDLAGDVLGHVTGEAQVTVVHERALTSRFARSSPTQATEVDAYSVHVLSIVEGHTGGASAATLDRDALAAAAKHARAAAEAAARGGPGTYPGLPAPAPAPARSHGGDDPETARLDPATAGAALGAAFAGAAEHGLEAYGIWTAGAVQTAIAATTGLQVVDRATDAFMKVVCIDDAGRSGYAAATGSSIAALDAAALTRTAAAKVRPDEPATLGPGAYPVVLDHDAVGVILDMLAWVGFDGLAHAEGRGALSGRLGTRVAAPEITLADAPGDPRSLPRAFDLEGVPKAPLALIQDGIAHRVVHDTRSAALAGGGARSTGHALAPGGAPGGVAPTNLVLDGGTAGGVDDLAAPIERGIYVTRLWYLNVVHERSATLTGVTRDGTFLIEDGRIARPLRDVRFTDSALRLLDATEALSATQRLVSEGEFYGTRFAAGVVCPALRAGEFRITGGR